MASKLENIAELTAQTAQTITRNFDRWTAFLTTAGNNYKYKFKDQVLIFEKKPDATACATIDFWNKHNRWVNRGSKGIPLIDSASNTIKYVFDISDTNCAKTNKPIYLWKMEDKYIEDVVTSLEDSFGELPKHTNFVSDIKSIASNIVDDNFQDYLTIISANKNNSLLEKLDEFNLEQQFKMLCTSSIQYSILSRCGIKTDDYFVEFDLAFLSNFNTDRVITVLGKSISDMSEMVLRQIEQTVVLGQKIGQLAIAKEKNLMHNNINNDRGGNDYEQQTTITDDNNRRTHGGNLDIGRRLLHPSMVRGGTTGGGTPSDAQVRKMEEQVPGRTSGNRIYSNANERDIGGTSDGNRPDGLRDGGKPNQADDEGTGRDGTTQGERPNEMGGNGEQHPFLREGNNLERADLHLTFPSEEQQILNIEEKAEEESPAFVISQEDIDSVLQGGSGFQDGKHRIYEQYSRNLSQAENATFLRNEYGIGGAYPAISGRDLSECHDGKGMTISRRSITRPNDELVLPWNRVAKRIVELIECDRYFSDKQKEGYVKYLSDEKLKQERGVIAEGLRDIVRSYNDKSSTENKLNQFVLIDCASRFRQGELKTSTLTMKGNFIIPLLEEALHTISQNDDELAPSAQVLLQDLNSDIAKPFRNYTEEKDVEVDRENSTYSLTIGTTVNIGIEKYEILHIDENVVRLYDENFPIINKEFARADFEKLVRENPLNDDLISEKTAIVQTDIVEVERLSENETENIIGQKVVIDDTEFIIEEVRDISGDVSLFDLSAKNYPIARVEKLDTVKKYLNQQLLSEKEIVEKSILKKKLYTNDLHPDIPLSDRNNFTITDDKLGVKSAREKFKDNISAIKTLKQLEDENRFATLEEQKILSNYVGWGGLADVFDETKSSWATEFVQLKGLLDEEEYSLARASTLTAFYTQPVVIKAIYKALNNMGFSQGNILEPSCATGNFFGLLPESMSNSKLYGIELDSVSGRISQQLYQKASIAIQGFENTSLPDSFFDVAIGNVPFGQFKVNDKKYNKNNFLIHDYFFAKTIDKVRPGGVIAFITSKGTMEKSSPEVRKYIAQRAELVGAIRLPDNAFKANAGTEVTSDIIFLQKRDRMIDIEPDWAYLAVDENNFEMNRYFVDNPEMVLGEMVLESTQYGYDSACKAFEGADLSEQLDNAVANIHAKISTVELETLDDDEDLSIPAIPTVRNFSFTIVDGKLYFRENSRMSPVSQPITTLSRIKGLVEIRELLRTLIEYQTEEYSDFDIKFQQQKLNEVYEKFVAKYGLITSRANSSAFSEDSSYPLIYSLEVIDDDGNFLRKADIFDKRTIKKHSPVTSVETASEALAVSLAEKAKVDIEFMSQLTGKDAETIITELRGVIFRNVADLNPETVPKAFYDINSIGFVTADEYLSGNVRNKLALVKSIANSRSDLSEQLQINLQALEKYQPTDLLPSEISVRLGATWIPENDVRLFIFEILNTPGYKRSDIKVNYSKQTAMWGIEGKNYDSNNINAINTFGTKRMNAYKIIEETLNLKDVRIYDYSTNADGKRVQELNKEQTTIAQQKQEKIKEKFTSWIWSDQQRRERLCRKYNDEFNNIRNREYDGSHLVFSGINPEISLRQHQLNAVAHIMYGGNTLLAHVVGAGKTYEMIAAAMESKRLGLCQKSLFVVPNHLTEQWASEFLQLYPGANILVTTKKNFETKNRKRFCARIATGDFDAVIIGHSQFEKIPMSIERQERILRDQLYNIISGISDLKSHHAESFTVKQLERTKKSIELKIEKLNDQSRKDDIVTFEELGVDRLFIDEAHGYKNLFLYTKMRNVGGIGQTDAQKSSDLFMKCSYIDELTGGKGIIFATGTPISNSMVEMYTMQRYLQYSRLEQLDMIHFDSWASTFGETETTFDLAVEGTGYRAKTKFSKYYNLPELMSMFKEVADIQTADMLNLPVPEVEHHHIVTTPSELQKQIVSSFADRAEQIRDRKVAPEVDNMLKVTNDGRKLALDQRLFNDSFNDNENSKLFECSKNVFDIWKDTEKEKSAQLVFCDISTPHYDGSFNVYDDLKKKLIDKGIPENEVAFIHDADTDVKKKELFGKVRNGNVRVLIGSTEKMGAGTNVQKKLVALHHLDCPWRPSDLAQREGRIVRQGNDNKKVHIYTYITKDTFDAYLYQLVESKQKFISQIMTSKTPMRCAEDIDEVSLSYAEIKALATGNPRIKEKMNLDTEVSKLKLLKASHLNERYTLEDKVVKHIPEQIQKLKERLEAYTLDFQHLTEKTKPNKDKFSPMTINSVVYTDKKEAGTALLECKKDSKISEHIIGEYRGFKMSMGISILQNTYYIALKNKGEYHIEIDKDAFGNIQRLDNALEKFSSLKTGSMQQINDLSEQLLRAKNEINKPFEKEKELEEKLERLSQLNIELTMDNKKIEEKAQGNDEGLTPMISMPGRGM